MASPTRIGMAALAALTVLLAACGRGQPAPAEPASFDEAMKLASTKLELNRWSEVFAACDAAFRHADRAGERRAILAGDCAAEAAARMGKPELGLPHYRRIVEVHGESLRTHGGGQRVANNLGVLLVERGRRDEGIARLEWALETYAGIPYSSTFGRTFTTRATIVKNLARAYYGTASRPEVRAWVHEQGTMLRDHMQLNAGSAHLAMGGSAALDALATIGRRQADMDTPSWEAQARANEPLEADIAARQPQLLQACEDIPLRTTLMQVCMRELAPPE
jgi:hypothetical protein